MSYAKGFEATLSAGKRKGRENDWLGAIEVYSATLDSIPADDLAILGELHEHLGYASCRAAMQADDVEEFRNRLNQAFLNFDKSQEAYSKTVEDDTISHAKVLRCEASKAYVKHWLAEDSSEKKILLDDCWNHVLDCISAFDKAERFDEYVKTYIQLSDTAIFLFTREFNFESRVKTIQDAIDYGEKAIKYLSESENASELTAIYAKMVVFLAILGYYLKDMDERDKYKQQGLSYSTKAKISEEIALKESVYPVFGGNVFFGLEASDEAFENYRKALELGTKSNDKFVTGCALDWITYHTAWKVEATDEPEEKKSLIEECARYAQESSRELDKLSFISPRGDHAWTRAIEFEKLFWLIGLETDLKKRRELTQEAFQWLQKNRAIFQKSGYPEIILFWHNCASVIRQRLAELETNPTQRKKDLEATLSEFNERLKTSEEITPLLHWNIGIIRKSLGNTQYQLATVTDDPEEKKNLLNQAAINEAKGIELCAKELGYFTKEGSGLSLFINLGEQQHRHAWTFMHLFELTNQRENLKKAVETLDASTESYAQLGLVSRIAENHWVKGQIYDKLGEHMIASQSFDRASENYASASGKFPRLKDFYDEYAIYMQAWSEIEKAKFHHQRQEYGLAKDHFEKSADFHKNLRRWNYLAPNYAAWAKLDYAEELSRKENGEEALQAFREASGFFAETTKSLKNQMPRIEEDLEKEMATQMLKATDMRQKYSLARVAVEEAKILDKKGEHFSSSEKYTAAAQTLEEAMSTITTEQDKREFDLIATLSKAWAKMTLAEAEESPSLYSEASQLFEKAKELSLLEESRTLALGHSRFCRALEAGMGFSDTGDEKLHDIAVQQLESAAKYYVKAGCDSASEYAKATELLLDAYSNINSAKRETDHDKKTKLFTIAEKLLQTSAGSFMKAEHPAKRAQVLRLLEKVKQERELAMSLSEVLHTPAIVSATSSFSSPSPNNERAVGWERFDDANVQATILIRQKQLTVGENMELDIELFNAGKKPALLIRVSEVIPEGFELSQKPENCRIEEGYFDMKGKQLGPLRTEELRLVLRAKAGGSFILKPKLQYLDEKGTYKSYEFDPIDISVKELGIKGWLKGER